MSFEAWLCYGRECPSSCFSHAGFLRDNCTMDTRCAAEGARMDLRDGRLKVSVQGLEKCIFFDAGGVLVDDFCDPTRMDQQWEGRPVATTSTTTTMPHTALC